MNKQPPTTKVVHATSCPYPPPVWPVISASLESTILDLLLPLLLPIGEYRDKHRLSTKGKKKNRKKSPNILKVAGTSNEMNEELQIQPDILRHITVGFNSTVSHMTLLAQYNYYEKARHQLEAMHGTEPFAAVFVCKSILPKVMTGPMPLLAARASPKINKNDGIRLIHMSSECATKIAEVLRQPKVSMFGIMITVPHSTALQDIIRDKIPAITVPGINEAQELYYQAVQVHSTDAVPGASSKKRKAAEEGEQEL